MTDLYRKTDVEIRLERLEKSMERMDQDGIEPILAHIATSLAHISACLLHISGLGTVEFNPSTEELEVRQATVEEFVARDTPPPKPTTSLGRTSTRHGDKGPIVWVLEPPAPFNDVEIVCSPDGASPIGMRCYAVRKVIGGEREKYDLIPQEKEGL